MSSAVMETRNSVGRPYSSKAEGGTSRPTLLLPYTIWTNLKSYLRAGEFMLELEKVNLNSYENS